MRQNLVAVLQFHFEHRIRQSHDFAAGITPEAGSDQ